MANFDHVKNDRANNDRANSDRDEGAFDGGEDGDDNEGSHLPVVIIIAILVLAAFGGVVWLAYNQGVARGRNDVPVRVAATQPSKTDDSGLKVYQQTAGPEEDGAKAAQATPQPAAPPPAQAQAQQTPAPAPAQTSVPAQPAPKTVAQAAPPAVTLPVAKPQPMAAAKPAPKPALQDLAPPQPQVATKPPAALGIAHPAVQAPVTPAATPLKPGTLKPATEVSAKPAAASGGYLLQIGAYKSEDEARAAWKTYQSKHATLLSGFGPDVQRTTHDDGSTWYRLRVASFSDKDAAAALCERLKAQGAACFVAK